MSEYKLIKWYPGLPDYWKNNKPTVSLNGSFFYAYDGTSGIHRDVVMSNPEFWEEVVDKTETNEYVILSYKGDYTDNIYRRDNDGKYYTSTGLQYNGANDISIYSVERKSDGEVFTIRDKVKQAGDKDYFRINRIGQNYGTVFLSNNATDFVCISHAIKKKEPLFTTEDGVDVHKGDQYFEVRGQSSYYTSFIAGQEPQRIEHTDIKFSTKEKAEEYIEENKSQYSKSDIRKAFKPLPLGKEHCNLVIKQLERNE